MSPETPFSEEFVIDAELTLSHGDTTFSIWSEDNRLIINAPSVRSLRMLDRLLTTVETLVDPASTVRSVLHTAGPTVEIQVRRAPIARSNDTAETPSSVTAIHTTLAGHPFLIFPRGLCEAAIRWFP